MQLELKFGVQTHLQLFYMVVIWFRQYGLQDFNSSQLPLGRPMTTCKEHIVNRLNQSSHVFILSHHSEHLYDGCKP